MNLKRLLISNVIRKLKKKVTPWLKREKVDSFDLKYDLIGVEGGYMGIWKVG